MAYAKANLSRTNVYYRQFAAGVGQSLQKAIIQWDEANQAILHRRNTA